MAIKRGRPGSAVERTLFTELFPSTLSKSDIRKIQILDASIETYSRIGIEYVSYEDLARSAKMSRPLVQHHFPDKGELFRTVIKYVRAGLQQQAVDAVSAVEGLEKKIRAYVAATCDWANKNPTHYQTWLFFYYQCSHDAGLRELHTEITEMGRERIVALLRSENAKVDDKSLESRAFQIQQAITGALIEMKAENGRSFQRIKQDTVELCLYLAAVK